MHHTLGRPRVEDAAAIHELIAAYDTAVIGSPDMTLDDVADELAEPGFDRDRDGWLARDGDGRLDGWAWACRVGDSDTVDVEVIVRPGVTGLDDRLWPLVIGRARELAAEAGHDGATLHIGVYRADTAKRDTAEARGFSPGTSFHRMRIDHDGPVEPPAPPAGLTLHTGRARTRGARRTGRTRRASPSTSGSCRSTTTCGIRAGRPSPRRTGPSSPWPASTAAPPGC